MRPLLRLYPGDWRERYGDELCELLAECDLRLADVVDLVRGAVDAWRHPIGSKTPEHSGGSSDMRLSLARWTGLILLLTGALGTVFVTGDRAGWFQLWSAAWGWNLLPLVFIYALLLISLAGIWIQARRAGQGSLVAEAVLLATVVAYLLWVASVVISPSLPPWATSDGTNQLELSSVVCGIVLQFIPATLRRLLPLWSTLALLLAAPALGLLATMADRHWLESFDHNLLCFSVVWTVVGGGLLLTSARAQPRTDPR